MAFDVVLRRACLRVPHDAHVPQGSRNGGVIDNSANKDRNSDVVRGICDRCPGKLIRQRIDIRQVSGQMTSCGAGTLPAHTSAARTFVSFT